MDQPTNKPCDNDLAALADGELAPERQQQIADHLAHHPEAARQVAFQLQFREAAARSLNDRVPAPPADLRNKIQAMLAVPAVAPAKPAALRPAARPAAKPSFWQTWRIESLRWAPTAVAALLFIGAILTFQTAVQERDAAPPVADAHLISNEQINKFSSQHVGCCTKIAKLRNADLFPKQIGLIPDAISSYLNKPTYQAMDLSPVGFEYRAAGTCNVPGSQSVHMIYQNNQKTGVDDWLSLWVSVYKDYPKDAKPDKIYDGNEPGRAHPIVYWRHGDLVYYLVGDSVEHVHAAAEALVHENPLPGAATQPTG